LEYLKPPLAFELTQLAMKGSYEQSRKEDYVKPIEDPIKNRADGLLNLLKEHGFTDKNYSFNHQESYNGTPYLEESKISCDLLINAIAYNISPEPLEIKVACFYITESGYSKKKQQQLSAIANLLCASHLLILLTDINKYECYELPFINRCDLPSIVEIHK